MGIKDLFMVLPEVKAPEEKRLSFGVKFKWTLIILAAFFILSNIPLYGMTENALQQFEYLGIILGASFGSIISLGIGPIVTASIVLQLLVGSKLLNIDLTNPEGKKYFQGLQKILTILFIVFESAIYVLMGGLQAAPGLQWLLIIQLCFGGLMIMFMDEVISKWGFGSGVGLFIVGGVASQLFTKAFGFIGPNKIIQPVGKIPVLIAAVINADTIAATAAFAAIGATIAIFMIVVYTQSIKVEVPLSFGRIRGFGIRWPLAFFYTSNIPVILAAALHANIQLMATLAERWTNQATFLGSFSQGMPISGLAYWLSAPPGGIIEHLIKGSFQTGMIWQSLSYALFMTLAAVMFAVFWVNTSGMDAKSQAKQIMSSGLQVPGFRRDPRVLESILSRYIMPLTIMGGAAVGLLAALADITGALVRGTAILLAVMIIYRLYEEVAQQHAMDAHPAIRKMIQ
jgi:preprotein translocase subunit SecY